MGSFSRSWQITKLAFSVIGQDKEMLLFPSIAYIAALIVPSGVLALLGGDGEADAALSILQYALLFVTYLGLAFIATFFNVCVVYTTKTRFEGGDASFMDSITFALSKLGVIFQWSLIAATVGLLLAIIDRLARRMGGAGQIVLEIVRSMLGMMWSIITIFVVPTLVYEDVSPMDAIKRSTEVIKRTWGESLIRHFGLGLIQFFCVLGAVALTVGLVMVMPTGVGTIIAISVGGICILGVVLVFNVANTIFNTALYVYASTGEEPAAFGNDTLANAFQVQ